MSNLTEIEIDLINIYKSVRNDYNRLEKTEKSTTWITKELLQRIGNLGIKKGFNVSSKYNPPEILYDLIWYKKENGNLSEIELILESELSNRNESSLKIDFEKLLFSKAKTKVMISFAEGNKRTDNVDKVKGIFKKSFESFKQNYKDERVLVLIWDDFMTGDIYFDLLLK